MEPPLKIFRRGLLNAPPRAPLDVVSEEGVRDLWDLLKEDHASADLTTQERTAAAQTATKPTADAKTKEPTAAAKTTTKPTADAKTTKEPTAAAKTTTKPTADGKTEIADTWDDIPWTEHPWADHIAWADLDDMIE